MTELDALIAESRALHAELRIHVEARKSSARSLRAFVGRSRRPVGVDEVRVVQMTSLLLEAQHVALRDEEGATIDLISDALTHLGRRLEREVLPKFD